MGVREGSRELEPDEPEEEAKADEPSNEDEQDGGEKSETKEVKPLIQTIKVTEYYVKYKNL